MPVVRLYPTDDPLDRVADLPRPGQRWTVRRKATVIQAVRGGWVPIEEAVEMYSISVDEFLAWERDLDRYGIPGLRTTRFQIYRDTDTEHGRVGRYVGRRNRPNAGARGSRDCAHSAVALAITGLIIGIEMQTPAEKIAHCLLTQNGFAAIWDLQCAADFARTRGNSAVAASLLEIAEAATEQLLCRNTPPSERLRLRFVPRE